MKGTTEEHFSYKMSVLTGMKTKGPEKMGSSEYAARIHNIMYVNIYEKLMWKVPL